jgi:uncharacterized protein (TIGR03435 family)
MRHVPVLLLAATLGLTAQSLPGPAFEVASIKPNDSGATSSATSWPPGSFSATNAQLRMLLAQALGIPPQLQQYVLVGGPEALLSARFDIKARAPAGLPEGQHFAMLKALLEERFTLRTHKETRQLPVYALVVAKPDGRVAADFRPSTIDCNAAREAARSAGQRFTLETAPRDAKNRPLCWGSPQFATPGVITLAAAGPLSDFTRSLQAFVDRPIVDSTGLAGNFEWLLQFAFGAKGNPDYPVAFTAVDEQLGLKLEARTAPIDVIVIDDVQPPTPD